MLVLGRKAGETIKIGKDIVIHILGVNGKTYRVGIDAPKDVVILRSEVAERDSASSINLKSSASSSGRRAISWMK